MFRQIFKNHISHSDVIHSMRGYRHFEEQNIFKDIRNLKRLLGSTALGGSSILSRKIFGLAVPNETKILRQFILSRLGGINLITAILKSKGRGSKSFYYPFPRKYREVLLRKGYPISDFGSSVFWKIFLLLIFFKALFEPLSINISKK